MRGDIPMARAVIRYCPPPSGNRMVNRPRASVCERRVTWVSSEYASTVASRIGVASSARATTPVMMSVADPIWAAAGAGAKNGRAAAIANGSQRELSLRGTGPIRERLTFIRPTG